MSTNRTRCPDGPALNEPLFKWPLDIVAAGEIGWKQNNIALFLEERMLAGILRESSL